MSTIDLVANLTTDAKVSKTNAALAAEYHGKADTLRKTAAPATVVSSGSLQD